ncbi:thaumatin family protein [Actinacidiphila sp. ITFR-21]|uniref:thaumatin family protein n=1 Tax=Actinacidiphila sp. ITFR-21 TaxID=3075199 RepID=UPI00288A2DFA|nr:thaumatin family protein [Streptomyces sp. ITFR-21]WNI14862.1 thaumatin family protein [Streptomyces sp. ITFR-21]
MVAAVAAVAVIVWPSGPERSPGANERSAVGAGPSAASSNGPGSELDRSARPSPTGEAQSTPGKLPKPAGNAAAAPRGITKKAAPRKPTATTAPPPAAMPAAPAGQRSITLVNRTQQVVWAVVTDSPAYPGGRRLQPGQSTSLTVGNSWGGRIWGRTGCAGDASGSCLTGDCTTGCGGPTTPTTLGEFTLNSFDGMDFYDVSMVDGSNLPMYINVSHSTGSDPLTADGCYKGACTQPVDCPAAMEARNDDGQVIGCKPPCAAFGGDTYCCRGAWAGRENCVPSKWPVDYTQVFKKAEPYAYSYAFDDSATMACKGGCYYRVTFGTS